jgi:hypothetical protein
MHLDGIEPDVHTEASSNCSSELVEEAKLGCLELVAIESLMRRGERVVVIWQGSIC